MRPNSNILGRESKDASMVISGISSVSNVSNYEEYQSDSQSIIFDSANVINNNGVAQDNSIHNSSGARKKEIPSL